MIIVSTLTVYLDVSVSICFQMVHVLRVRTNDMVTFPISNKHTMNDLKSALFQKFNIPVAEQELLLASGITPDPSKPAVQCCAEVVCYTYTIVYNKDMFRAPHKIHLPGILSIILGLLLKRFIGLIKATLNYI